MQDYFYEIQMIEFDYTICSIMMIFGYQLSHVYGDITINGSC